MNEWNLKLRVNVKFYEKIGESASETPAQLKMDYGEYAMKKSSIFSGTGSSR